MPVATTKNRTNCTWLPMKPVNQLHRRLFVRLQQCATMRHTISAVTIHILCTYILTSIYIHTRILKYLHAFQQIVQLHYISARCAESSRVSYTRELSVAFSILFALIVANLWIILRLIDRSLRRQKSVYIPGYAVGFVVEERSWNDTSSNNRNHTLLNVCDSCHSLNHSQSNLHVSKRTRMRCQSNPFDRESNIEWHCKNDRRVIQPWLKLKLILMLKRTANGDTLREIRDPRCEMREIPTNNTHQHISHFPAH